MKNKPRWKDREGNLYADCEVVQVGDAWRVILKPVTVIPLGKKFPK